MKKSRIFALVLALVMMLSLFAGCGGGTETSAQPSGEAGGSDLLAQIQERGTIIIAMEGTWSPWTYHDEEDNLVGFDVEVGAAIAEKLGVEPVYEEGGWDGLLEGIEGGRYDIMVNGVGVTDERRESYSFSDPYCYDRTAVIVREDDDSITKMEDLEGKSTANTISSTYAEIAEGYGATVTGVDDFNQTIELLLQGRIDATLNAEGSYLDYISVHPDSPVKVACYNYDVADIAIPMRKSDDTESLRAAINTAISELREDGTLTELSMKYFGVDITVKPE